MEGTKHILLAVALLLSLGLRSQPRSQIYRAYAAGDMGRWKIVMDSVGAVKQKTNKETLELIGYQYGYIAWCIGNSKEDEAKRYLRAATAYVEKLEQQKYGIPTLYAFKAAFIGFEIGFAKYKAPFIGPRSLEFAKASVRLDTLNALGYMQLGNIAYYTPRMFGGSTKEAIGHYLKALKILESNREYGTSTWSYLNLLATIVSAYMDEKQYELAKKYCLRALAVEPNFTWVKKSLYPQVQKKLKQ